MTIRRLLVLLGAMALVAIVVVIAGGQFQPAADTAVETAIVTQTTLKVTVEGSGSVQPEQTVSLTFGVAEIVRQVDVEVGDTVENGQLLASLDTTDLELQVAQAEQAVTAQQAVYDQLAAGATEYDIAQARAAVAQAGANVAAASTALGLRTDQVTINCASLVTAQDMRDTAQEGYDDYVQAGLELDPLFMPDSDSEVGRARRDAQTAYDSAAAQCHVAETQAADTSAVDAAQAALEQTQARLNGLLAGATQAQLDAASAQLEAARIQLQQAQARLEDARLVAPFSGLVVAVNITPGQRVNTNTVALTLVDNRLLHLDVAVDELDIPSVAVGQPVTVTLESLPDTDLPASVVRVNPAGYLSQGLVNYTVRVNLVEPEAVVLLGMSANVEILVDTLEDVLVVPREAVQSNDEQGEFVLVPQPEGEALTVPVTVGKTINGWIIVEGDLTPGESVLLSPAETARRSFSLFGG